MSVTEDPREALGRDRHEWTVALTRPSPFTQPLRAPLLDGAWRGIQLREPRASQRDACCKELHDLGGSFAHQKIFAGEKRCSQLGPFRRA